MKRSGHPTLLARHRCRLMRRRRLPTDGEVLVAVGQILAADEVVARTRSAGALLPVNVAHSLDVDPADVVGLMLVTPGQPVVRGEAIARRRGLWGLVEGRCRSPISGVLKEVSSSTGIALVETAAGAVNLRALLAGTVVATVPRRGADIEGIATVVQGVLGVGGEAWGEIAVVARRPEGVVTADMIGPELAGRVVLGGALVTGEALQKAQAVGMAALITGGVEAGDLDGFLNAELAVAVTGAEDVRPAVVITGGFGRVPADPVGHGLLREREGELATVSAATRIRAGAVRPEILVPDEALHGEDRSAPGVADVRDSADGSLVPGRRVRLVGAAHLGLIGTVRKLLDAGRQFSSGARLPAVEVVVSGQRRLVVPRANVELLDTPASAGGSPEPADREQR